MTNSNHYNHGQRVTFEGSDGRVWSGRINRHVEQLGDRAMPEGMVHVDYYHVDSIPCFSRPNTALVPTAKVEVTR